MCSIPDDDEWYDLEDDTHEYDSDDIDDNNIIFQEEVDRLDYNPYNIEER
tara:strand:+ start:1035 stop:1184 length:150 start_codon:yes stop_codon:yes gene_type:complete